MIIDREIASIKRDLQIRMWRYLDANLDDGTKKKFKASGERAVQEILGHISDWVYEQRATLLIQMANRVAGMKRGSTDYISQIPGLEGDHDEGIISDLQNL